MRKWIKFQCGKHTIGSWLGLVFGIRFEVASRAHIVLLQVDVGFAYFGFHLPRNRGE